MGPGALVTAAVLGWLGLSLLLPSRTPAGPSEPLPVPLRPVVPYTGDPHDGGGPTPPGPRFQLVHTPAFPGRSNRRLFVRWTVRFLRGAPELAPYLERGVAELITAHFALETGWGRGLYNNNWGNVKEFGRGPWVRLPDTLAYRSYPGPVEGMRDFFRVMNQRNFKPSWEQLLRGDPRWYTTVSAAGYNERVPAEAQRDYDSVLAIVRRELAA